MEVDQSPTPQALPSPSDPCRRCEHPFSQHAEMGECTVELSKSAVPGLDFGGVCPCAGFVFEPATESPEDEPELLDGPAMYAEALGYVRIARTCRGPGATHIETDALNKAATYFAGAAAAAMGMIVAENGTGDIHERRWRAALADEDTLPEEGEA